MPRRQQKAEPGGRRLRAESPETTGRGVRRRDGHRPRSRAGTVVRGDPARYSGRQAPGHGRATGSAQGKAKPGRSKQQPAEGGATAKAAGPTRGEPQPGGSKQQEANAAAEQPSAGPRQEKGIYVYGILPADVEMAAEMPGVGDSPGLLRVVRRGSSAAVAWPP